MCFERSISIWAHWSSFVVEWLHSSSSKWPRKRNIPESEFSNEQMEICLVTSIYYPEPILPNDHYSSFNKLKRITAWVLRFVNNCRKRTNPLKSITLSVEELNLARNHWLLISQGDHFRDEANTIKEEKALSKSSCLLSLRPTLDSNGLLRVGGRISNSELTYTKQHPIILHGKIKLQRW